MSNLQDLADRTARLENRMESLERSVAQLKEERRGNSAPDNSKDPQATLSIFGTAPLVRAPGPSSLPNPPVPEAASYGVGLALDEDPERRGAPRRWGNPVAVQVCVPGKTALPFVGWAVDRSPEGVCLALPQPFPVGARLRVRPTQGAGPMRWFPVEVRNSRQDGNVWLLGCRFEQELNWTDLRLFN